mgnify:CR=1 FL=1
MGIDRQIKRKQANSAAKDLKRAMKNAKRVVKCNLCSRVPVEGEKIDDWLITQKSGKITLVCSTCIGSEDVGV